MVDIYSAYTADSITSQNAAGPLLVYAYEPQGRLLAVSNIRDESQLLQTLGVATRQQAFARLLHEDAQVRQVPPRPGPIREAAREGRLLSRYDINPFTGPPSLVGMVTLAEGPSPYFRRVVFESIGTIKAQLEAREQGRYLVTTADRQVATRGARAHSRCVATATGGSWWRAGFRALTGRSATSTTGLMSGAARGLTCWRARSAHC
ncbi:hypothetical protein G6F32_014196 [Rhizopus arrhizus]|nr:hypothetical protein G6F32_014196 [Rhizopus arrhizus]